MIVIIGIICILLLYKSSSESHQNPDNVCPLGGVKFEGVGSFACVHLSSVDPSTMLCVPILPLLNGASYY
jgi:hypothetical protein